MYSAILQSTKTWGIVLLLAITTPFPAKSADQPPPSPKTALITFSGVYNGTHPWSDISVVHRPMPSNYQPLMEPSPRTTPVDGGDLHTLITWEGACVTNRGYNPHVFDHTGDNGGSRHEWGGGVLFGTSSFAMTFSRPVEIPSLFWTFYIPTTKAGIISVYRRPGDRLPLKSVELSYPDTKGYVWRQLTGFDGLSIQKITFDPGDDTHSTGLNIDDMTIETGNR